MNHSPSLSVYQPIQCWSDPPFVSFTVVIMSQLACCPVLLCDRKIIFKGRG